MVHRPPFIPKHPKKICGPAARVGRHKAAETAEPPAQAANAPGPADTEASKSMMVRTLKTFI